MVQMHKNIPNKQAFLLNKNTQKTKIHGLKRKFDSDDQEPLEITGINDEIHTMPVRRTQYGGKWWWIVPDSEDETIKMLKYYVTAISMQNKQKFTAIDITENGTNKQPMQCTWHHLNDNTQDDNVITIPHTLADIHAKDTKDNFKFAW